MKTALVVFVVTGSFLVAGGLSVARGQEKKKAAPAAVKLQVELEEIKQKEDHFFLTGTFRITQAVGGETVASRLVDVPIAPQVKINKDWVAGTPLRLQVEEDQGGLVVVGIEAIGKGPEPKKDKK
jgi:hypothetical protein